MPESENLFIIWRVIHKKSAALCFNSRVSIVRLDQLMEHVDYGMWEKGLVFRHLKVIMERFWTSLLMRLAPNLPLQVLTLQLKYTAFLRLLVCSLWKVPNFVIPGHDKDISKVTFNPQGTKVLTAGFDQIARLWDSETGELLQEL